MFVDQRGMHCFLLCDHEIFYNHYNSERVSPIPTNSLSGGSS